MILSADGSPPAADPSSPQPLQFDAMREDLLSCLRQVHREVLERREGRVASYIPELAKADPEHFGLAACTLDGEVVGVGDDHVELTLQSLSKPFVYGWALDRFGVDDVDRLVGVEPTGDAFDSIIQLDGRHRPHNPMINAGAIAITGLFAEAPDDGSRIAGLLAMLSAFAGRDLDGIEVSVYLSERNAGHRNRAIAHLMRHLGMLEHEVDAVLDLYFRQCSVLVSCRDLAVMAAALANGGRCPVTKEEVVPPVLVRRILAVMCTCGFYDGAGRFAFEVGLPAKSGVSGGVIAVAPGKLGVAAFSPRLDEKGASVRGQVAIRAVSDKLQLHIFQSPPSAFPVQSVSGTGLGSELRSTVEATYGRLETETGGKVAAYLPPTSKAAFAISVCSVDGEELAIGDAELPFSIQSVANPFAYALALDALGAEEVHRWVGLEPSDNPFDAIHFDPKIERPFNPLDNAGAISVCARVPGATAAARLERLLEGFAAFAGGREMVVDPAVVAAESAAGELNRAIASLLRNFSSVDDEAAALDLYFRQCAIRVSCATLARMAATLAGGGIQPQTRRPVVAPDVARDVLSVMLTCGLHDESGRFAVEVGLPAKTGISGGIVAVVPGRMGVAVYSPAVNEHGSSVRGLTALRDVSQRLELSVFGSSVEKR